MVLLRNAKLCTASICILVSLVNLSTFALLNWQEQVLLCRVFLLLIMLLLWTQLENTNRFCNYLDIIAAGLPHMPHFFIVLLHTFHK
jgi:hypothetical protein